MIGFMVPVADLEDVKDVVMPLLVRGEKVDPGRFSAAGVWKAIEAEKTQLWMVTEDKLLGICVTAIINHPGLKVCEIQLCSGEEVIRWVHMLEKHVEPWARENGCKAMEGLMRPEWERLLPDYRVHRLYMEKSL